VQGCVGDEPQRKPPAAQTLQRLHRTSDRLLLDVQHAVEIDEQRSDAVKHVSKIADRRPSRSLDSLQGALPLGRARSYSPKPLVAMYTFGAPFGWINSAGI